MEQVTFSSEINNEALRAAVEAVEDNNRLNGGQWADWEDSSSVESAYGVTLCSEGAAVVGRAIKSNGASVDDDLPAVELAAWGQNFAGSFWDRG